MGTMRLTDQQSLRIAELPEDFRLALVAVDVLGLSYREAARALHVREATITTRLFRARKQVAERLAPEPEPPQARRAGGARDSAPPRSTMTAARGEQIRPSGVLPSRETR